MLELRRFSIRKKFLSWRTKSCGLTLQSLDGAGGAAAELINLHAHALGKGDEEVGKRRVVFWIMGGMVAVFVTTTGKQNGQVVPAV